MNELPRNPPSVEDVRRLDTIGPWPSKCGGDLRVPVMLPHAELSRLLEYDAWELEQIGIDIRGIRVFYIRGARAGGMAGNQFHRIRTEIAFLVDGSARWEFEDLYGGTSELHAARECALLIPPFVLHRVTFDADGATLATLANTLYVRDDPRTHDTYSLEAFRSMQELMRRGGDAR